MTARVPEPLDQQIERSQRARRERKALRAFAPIGFGAFFGLAGLVVSTLLGLSERWAVALICTCAGTIGPTLVAGILSRNPEWGGAEEDSADD